MAKIVSNVYGNALFELAVEQNKMKEYEEEARALVNILDENPDLLQMMTHPNIDKEEKLNTVESIFKGKASDEIVGLMRMVVEKNHFKEMKAIFNYFISRAMEYQNIGVAFVATPMELSAEKKEEIVKKLEETTDYVSFEMHYKVQPELIGGMVVRIGDRVVDSSIRTKIEHLSREMQKIQLKVGDSTP